MLKETGVNEMIKALKDYLVSMRGKAIVTWWVEWMTMVAAVSFGVFWVALSFGLALGLAAVITLR
jgi:hypothetical protein